MRIKIGVFILIVLSIFGCANNSVIKNNDNIKLWYGWTGEEEQQLITALSSYAKTKDIKIEFKRLEFDKLQTTYTSETKNSNGPDLIIGPNDWIGVFKELDLIQEIDEYIPSDIESEFIKTAWDACKNDNKLYALPESIKSAAMFYNRDIIATLPKNTDEMITISRELINSGKVEYGLVYDHSNYYYHAGWVGGFGESILDNNKNPTFNTNGQINAVEFVNSLRNSSNKIMPAQTDYNIMMTLFIDKKCGMIITGPWAINDLKAGMSNLGVGEMPIVSSTGLYSKPFIGIEAIMLSKKSSNKEKSIEIIKYFASEDFQAKLVSLNHIPSKKSTYNREDVKSNSNFNLIDGFRRQAEKGYSMPSNVEMTLGIWANGGKLLSDVFENRTSIEAAANKAQSNAMNSIENYRKNKK